MANRYRLRRIASDNVDGVSRDVKGGIRQNHQAGNYRKIVLFPPVPSRSGEIRFAMEIRSLDGDAAISDGLNY